MKGGVRSIISVSIVPSRHVEQEKMGENGGKRSETLGILSNRETCEK